MRNRKLASTAFSVTLASAILFSGNYSPLLTGTATVYASEQSVVVQNKKLQSANVESLSNGKLKISWVSSKKNSGEAKIYWSTSPTNIKEKGKLLKKTKNSSITIKNPNPKARPYFYIETADGASITVAERRVSLQGVPNYRDLGGYKTNDGRTVKWGVLFRSDELAGLTNADQKYIKNSGLKLIADYRSDDEVAKKPDPVLDGIIYERIPVDMSKSTSPDMSKLLQSGSLIALGKPGEYLTELNKQMVHSRDAYSGLFEMVENADNLPMVQHCTAGKDRTGLGSALLLLALGVPEDTVMEDYLLSNEYRAEANKKAIAAIKPYLKDEISVEIFTAIMEVRKEYLQAALDEIKNEYGSVDKYLEKELGLTKKKRKQLQDALLEK
ncbi:tyrosine-protein phosphatase [Brevibacillus ginsengisoli]|uniref:tyrosine-protein phosphatase n=1 Tax=Brevibacillus ginsengisoli TaxID=363854 RepID=UPI003CEA39DA